MYVCIYVCMYVCMYVCLFVCLSACLPVCLCVRLSAISVSLLCVCPSVYPGCLLVCCVHHGRFGPLLTSFVALLQGAALVFMAVQVGVFYY
jgi:hypothetical protein